ncbi:f383b0e4-d9b5-40ca-9f51-3802e1c0a5e3 [Sclerotinia trifoliorum]|uniref:F383b0e4-d9b5-40ca-9f51-3802e1c0a5e3 n=1 Tax=Sclerotinia trifoliorum TaxID=28548 RepID=A0A8H2VTP5_9HELO|nr:f383b0e4-d9b5-40ca-9f51-3802e1c0a5e3 [Sclerotinia trifoliorum]
MAFESGTAYPESDADDEYERSVHNSSPVLANDSEDSDGLSSNEHTPTTYGNHGIGDSLSEAIITCWTEEHCAEFVRSLGLRLYDEIFLDNGITGDVLVALHHNDLKDMGITSVGHRLTILKNVYDIKIKQDVPVEGDHYVPLSDVEAQYATATLKDIKYLVEQLKLRDERMSIAEMELRRLTAEYTRLREDLLPVFRMAKEGQPLPYHPPGTNNQSSYSYDTNNTLSPPAPTPSSSQSGLSRKFSTKKLFLESTPKNASPTFNLQPNHDRSMMEQALDPANAAERAVLSSSHLSATNNGSQSLSPGQPSPNQPSPTSPPPSHLSGSTLASRSYRSDQQPTPGRSTFPQNENDQYPPSTYSRDSTKPAPSRRAQTPALEPPSGGGASVEIFKSFRVSMEDPCYKVLPAALKKYNINAPWEQYALYIVYGDKERCLGMEEKPLILFKQLDKEGKKPMFMLRKISPNTEPGIQDVPGSAGLDGRNGGRGGNNSIYDPPGGII